MIWRALLIFAAATLLCTATARAQGVLERLVTPGELSQAHAEFEDKCESCHNSFNKTGQPRLCLTCHKPVTVDLVRGKGFHGRKGVMRTQNKRTLVPCKTCHTEHKGRRFDIDAFDHAAFDHTLTDFALDGGHRKANCRDCHLRGKKFRDAPATCVSCHGKNDPHKGEFGNDCAACHTARDWREVTFDHGQTRFPLTGRHAKARCAACHTGGRFKGAPTECISCHRKDDKHRGRFGESCKTCHTANGWKTIRFDHNRDTDYDLIGGHRTARCESCHTGTLYKDKVDRQCITCHAKDDAHKGSAGPRCESCHSPLGWKSPSFDHDTKTRFPLRGAHAGAPCKACHVKPPEKVKPPKACIGCHAKDDAHDGRQGTACGNCHTETGWRTNVRFDHDFAAFPLIGRHERVDCAACHRTKVFKDAPSACFDCHRDDDRHKGTLGRKCATCHNPTGWEFWHFDHATQTDFPLTGAHDGLECAACHREKSDSKVRRSTQCITCHRKDDIHNGGFGRNCERCHNTQSFSNPSPLRH